MVDRGSNSVTSAELADGPSYARCLQPMSEPAVSGVLAAALSRLAETPPQPVSIREPKRTPRAAKPMTAEDRRAFPRRDSSCRVWITRAASLAPQQNAQWLMHTSRLRGEMLDLSMNGISFLLSENLDAEEMLFVRLENPHFSSQIDTVARVIRTSEVGDGRWKVVCRFLKNLSFDEAYEFARHVGAHQVV